MSDAVSSQRLREATLRDLAKRASDATPTGQHVGDPLLALMRDGDTAEDLNDAVVHVSQCALCRARLSDHVARRSVVVMAIEAPRASQRDLAKAAEETNARLLERGEGRWTAVVDAERAGALKESLEKPESSVVSRLAIGTPFQVPAQELDAARKRLRSSPDLDMQSGTDVAEVQAWAQVARKKPKPQQGVSAAWVLFAILVIAAAMVGAYLLASGSIKK